MIEQLNAIGFQASKQIEGATSLEALEQVRISVLGKKGSLSEVLKGLGGVSPQERPTIGAVANDWKRKLETALEEQKSKLEKTLIESRLQQERIDISVPSRSPFVGSLHPITQTTRKIISVFSRLGFDVTTGPEAETDFLNFEAVNIPEDHPARDTQDTFFLGPGTLLRTHTSSVQMRAMRTQSWPLRILSPGAVYRCDNDATHSPMFHQVEGLWVDKNVRLSDLKGVLGFWAREMFGKETKIRLRSSFFPFVEPGAEVDVTCMFCKGAKPDCKVCKGTGWLEILGSGMVHPRLLELANYKGATGFAFGIGIERVAMLLYGVPDLRLMFQNDVRFLGQFV